MLDTLITSKTRIKLLVKFFLNSKNTSYLRDLESEFHESTNAIRHELNRFEGAGLLTSFTTGNKKVYKANTSHPLYADIHNIVLKFTGLDQVIDNVIGKLGGITKAFLVGDIAHGLDSRIIDLVLMGENIDKIYLVRLIKKAESLINRRIRYIIMTEKERSEHADEYPDILMLWEIDHLQFN